MLNLQLQNKKQKGNNMKAENKIQPEGILEQDVELFSHKDISEDNILFEDVKKRDERIKHFRTKDSNYIAATFRTPILLPIFFIRFSVK